MRCKEGVRMAKLIKVIDVTKCTACRGCQVACKNWNQNPAVIEPTNSYQSHKDTNAETYTLVKFTEYVDPAKGIQWLFRKHQCMHCDEPACMEVCPRQAYSKNEWGATVHDPSRCIGCQYCHYACPWNVPKYLKREDIVTKCTLCANRVQAGLESGKFKAYPLSDWPEQGQAAELGTYVPACVKTCPSGALRFGEESELLSYAHERVKYLRENGYPEATLYGAGYANVVYVLGYKPEVYGLPAEPKTPGQIGFWQKIVQPYIGWLIPLALGASVVSFFTTRFIAANEGKAEEGGHE